MVAKSRRRAVARPATKIAAALVAALWAAGLALAPAVLGAQTVSATADKSQVGLLVPTVVRLTITNIGPNNGGGESIGCVQSTLPNAYGLNSVTIASVSNGGAWSVAMAGNTFTAHAAAGGDRLLGDPNDDDIVLRLNVTGQKVGGAAWVVKSWNKTDCSSKPASASVQMTVVVVALPTPTPKPTPKPTPTPRPTPVPTPRPTPQSTPTPTPDPAATAEPASPVPQSSAPSMAPSPSASGTASPLATTPPLPSGGPFGGGPIGIVPVASLPPGRSVAEPFGPAVAAGTEVSFSGVGLDALGMIGPFLVPGFIVGASGFVILLIILLQAIGAAVWLPIVRRRIGDFSLGQPKPPTPQR